MRRVVALLVVVTLVMAVAVPAADAGGGTAVNVALGLASLAVFNQIVGGLFYPRPVYAYPAYYPHTVVVERPVYYSPPVYTYPAQSVMVQPAAPSYSRVVEYPHGRYQLYGDGVQTAYQWVWIPNPPPPPAAPPPPPAQ